MRKISKNFKTGELVFIITGVLFLVNAFVLNAGGDFTVLLVAKLAYLLGLILILFDK